MPNDLDSLRERYSTLADDELQNLAIEGGLTEQARELLDQELRRRGIQDVSGYQEHLERFDQAVREKKQRALQRREARIRWDFRLGCAAALLIFFTGLYFRFLRHDQKTAVGVFVAAVALLVFVWIMAFVRRLIWRLLLKP